MGLSRLAFLFLIRSELYRSAGGTDHDFIFLKTVENCGLSPILEDRRRSEQVFGKLELVEAMRHDYFLIKMVESRGRSPDFRFRACNAALRGNMLLIRCGWALFSCAYGSWLADGLLGVRRDATASQMCEGHATVGYGFIVALNKLGKLITVAVVTLDPAALRLGEYLY